MASGNVWRRGGTRPTDRGSLWGAEGGRCANVQRLRPYWQTVHVCESIRQKTDLEPELFSAVGDG